MSWREAALGDISQYIGRGRSPVYDEESSFPVLNQACIQHGHLDLSKLKFISEAHYQSLERTRRTNHRDIFVNSTGTGTLGRIAYWDNDSEIAFDGHVTLVRLAPDYDSRYFYYWLHMPEAQTQILNNCISGSTNQIELSREAFRKIRVKYPAARDEQTAIAEILATVDRAIEQTEALIAKQRRIKAGLLHDLLTRGIDEQGNLRDPATHRFKQSALGLIPEEWEVVKLKEVCTKIGVGIATSTTKHFVERDGVPLIRNQNIREEGIISDDLLMISKGFSEFNHNRKLKVNDILTVRTGYPGLSCVVTQREEGWQTFTTLISRPNTDLVDSHFIALVLNSWSGRRQVNNLQAGGAQQNLNASQVAELGIALPNVEEQLLIVEAMLVISDNIQNQRLTHDRLCHIKSGLMQDLLSGRVSVAGLVR